MRVANSAHTSQPWRIHELVPDFRLEDVWNLPVTGGAEDFAQVVQQLARFDPAGSSSRTVRTLFAARWKIGEWLGWDDVGSGIDSRVPTVLDRLPIDLRLAQRGPIFDALPFNPLYLLRNEFAAEIANKTMHGVLHLGWVPDGAGSFRAQMAVYVKPNGVLGEAYLAAIKPFRYLLVYPPLLRQVGRSLPEERRPATAT